LQCNVLTAIQQSTLTNWVLRGQEENNYSTTHDRINRATGRGGFKEWPLMQWTTRLLPYGPRGPLMVLFHSLDSLASCDYYCDFAWSGHVFWFPSLRKCQVILGYIFLDRSTLQLHWVTSEWSCLIAFHCISVSRAVCRGHFCAIVTSVNVTISVAATAW